MKKLNILIFFVFFTSVPIFSEYKRIEYSLSYDILKPTNIYGSWKSSDFLFFHSPRKDYTYFIGFSNFWRKEGNASLFTTGLYKDWSRNFYTFTSISYGSKSEHLPKFIFHNDFNFKTGKNKNFVPSIGFSFINYHNIHKDTIITAGFTYYQQKWNLTYKHFINKSDPGNIKSNSNLISIGIGEEKKSWTYIDLSYGKQAYLATYLANPEEIRQNSFFTSLKHRKWIKENSGIFIELNYLNLENGYQKYGFKIGFFKEF